MTFLLILEGIQQEDKINQKHDLTYNIDYNSVFLHILSMVIFYFLLYIFYIRMFWIWESPFSTVFLKFYSYSFIVLPISVFCYGQVSRLCTTQLQNSALFKQLYIILFYICCTFQNFQMKQSHWMHHQVPGSKVEHSPPLTVIVIRQVNEYFPLTKVNKLGDVFLSS